MNAIGVDVGGTKIAAGVVSPEGEILNEVRYPTPALAGEAGPDHRPGHQRGRGRVRGGRGVPRGAGARSSPRRTRWSSPPTCTPSRASRLKDEMEPKIGHAPHGRERRERRGVGGVPVRGGERGGPPGFRHARHRGRGRCDHARRPAARRAGRRRRARARDDPGHRPPLRLRQPRLPGGPGLGHRHSDAAPARSPASTRTPPLAASPSERRVLGEDVTELAREGDEAALSVLEEAGTWLGIGLAGFVNVFNPEVIAVGRRRHGGGRAHPRRPARREVHLRARPPSRDLARSRWRPSEPRSGVSGAAALARDASGEYVLGG